MDYQTFKTEAEEALLNYVTNENYYDDEFAENSFFVEHIQNNDRLKPTDRIEIKNSNSDNRYSVYYTAFGISEVTDTSC